MQINFISIIFFLSLLIVITSFKFNHNSIRINFNKLNMALLELAEGEFENEITKSSVPVVVDFSANWYAIEYDFYYIY